MLKLLIVDDEQAILDGLKVIIDWKQLGVELVGTADNGIKAFELALTYQPDIILTDIRMPEMNGLELIRKIKAKLPKANCILLTGYQEFDYVREALKNGAAGYLLKPVDEAELCNLMRNIREKWISDSRERTKLADLNQKLIKTTSYMRNQLLFSLVNGEVQNFDELLPMLNSYGIEKFPQKYLCFIIDIELEQGNDIFNSSDSELVKFAAANIADEIINDKTEGIVFYTYETKVISIMEMKNERSEIEAEEVLNEILVNIKNFLNMPVAIGVSSVSYGAESIAKSYKEAKRALKYKMLSDDVVHYTDIENSIAKIYSLPLKTEKKLANCILCGDRESISEIVDELYADFSSSKVDKEGFLFALRDIIAIIRRDLSEIGYDVTIITQQVKNFFEDVEKCSSDSIKGLTAKLFVDLVKDISALNPGRCKTLVMQIKQYIDENYSEQLTLNTISDKFYIHSSYFSRLFKKETSGNFIDYLTNKRIEEAKKLLIGTDLKIYEIAERIGYGNPKYFSKLFERYVGMNPKEYRSLANQKAF